MDYNELMAALQQVPNAREITLLGRKNPILSCSVPEDKPPAGWRWVNEAAIQRIDGWMRIRLVK